VTLDTLLLSAWALVTAVLVILLIYRSTLTIHEDDQLFLAAAEDHMAQEQKELMERVNKLQPLVRLFGAASGGLILVLAGVWIYRGVMMNW
jgi:predicted ABC-type exoprotein transport system permease subunit